MNEASPVPPSPAHQIRRQFLEFFAARSHTVVPSSPLIPQDDPTLLFVNAGMVQFKDVFLGREQREYRRAASVQRCLRAGGKHNDLENVGYTPRHHTLFEMLGNFSFGDYFKADAIRWGWEFLTEVLGISKDRLVVSVFNGAGERAPYDQEAYDLWCEFLPRDRIYACAAKENFWQMGDTGPCGPCSEIHIFGGDQAPGDAERGGPFGPEHEDDKYLELWNLVFMQYEKRGDGSLSPLPRPSIDTGAGLERLAAVCEGVRTNYETGLLKPLVDHAKALAGVDGPQGETESSYQVIADHARATTFLIADGIFPDRAGRSYVLRRIMRRAIRYGTQVGLEQPFFHDMCRATIACFSEAYPELEAACAMVDEVVRAEETAFRRTLARGLKRVQVAMEGLGVEGEVFPVAVAAELYDTYGFPVDLTALIARERGLRLDEPEVDLEIHRRQGTEEAFQGQGDAVQRIYFEVANALEQPPTFVGYETENADATVLAIVDAGCTVASATVGARVEIVFSQTPFYAESGGQVGDAGAATGQGFHFRIDDTRKPAKGVHFHAGALEGGALAVGDVVRLEVDSPRRQKIRNHHSATHLLHHALRAVLGPHVVQKGSLVGPSSLRFDFSHPRPLSAEERHEVERRINVEVRKNSASCTDEMGLDAAKRSGAMGLFDEKYADRVRVVRIGSESVELCGGTHVARTGEIGSVLITSETGIAQGVRRMEAVTGEAATHYVQRLGSVVSEASARLHAGRAEEILAKIDRLAAELKAQTRENAELKRQLATGGASVAVETIAVADFQLLVKRVKNADPKTLRQAADTLRDRLGNGVVVLGSDAGGKAHLLVAATKNLVGRVHAGTLVKVLAIHIEGRGGGRPELAQAGGPRLSGLDAALAGAADALRAQLSNRSGG
ncbi:MAG: alanine--tRNA ligase [Nannocystaceae bacterium]